MEFDQRDLRLFHAIAQHSNITHAAQTQHLSLPAASARVKAMEERAGVPLLLREARGVRLTPAGEAFLHHANTTAVTDIRPAVLPAFLKANPSVTVELTERQNPEIVLGVLDGRADVGIVSTRIEAPGLCAIPFSTDNLVLVVPRSHRFAKRKSISLAEIDCYGPNGQEAAASRRTFDLRRRVPNGRSGRRYWRGSSVERPPPPD